MRATACVCQMTFLVVVRQIRKKDVIGNTISLFPGKTSQYLPQSVVPSGSFSPRPGPICRRISARLVLEMDVGKLLTVVIAPDEARLLFFDGPGRREAGTVIKQSHGLLGGG